MHPRIGITGFATATHFTRHGPPQILDELVRLDTCPDDQYCTAFNRFVALVEKTFRDEEATMEEIAYDGLRLHREQHAYVLAALHKVAQQVMQGNTDTGRIVTILFKDWLHVHTDTLDKQFAHALHSDEESDMPARMEPVWQ